MPRKTDPRLIALQDQRDKARVDFERWYAKFHRAVAKMDKLRGRIRRLTRAIDTYQPAQKGPDA